MESIVPLIGIGLLIWNFFAYLHYKQKYQKAEELNQTNNELLVLKDRRIELYKEMLYSQEQLISLLEERNMNINPATKFNIINPN